MIMPQRGNKLWYVYPQFALNVHCFLEFGQISVFYEKYHVSIVAFGDDELWIVYIFVQITYFFYSLSKTGQKTMTKKKQTTNNIWILNDSQKWLQLKWILEGKKWQNQKKRSQQMLHLHNAECAKTPGVRTFVFDFQPYFWLCDCLCILIW